MSKMLPELLKQVALYWEQGEVTATGRRDYSGVTPIEIPCHWKNEIVRFNTNDGTVMKTHAFVWTSYEVKQGGVLWLSSALTSAPAGTALAETPSAIPTNQLIEDVERHWSVEGDEVLYQAMV